MTAGSGLIHAEISSEAFKEQGGPLEILQLWVNLPAKYKMTTPHYTGLQKKQIPVVSWDGGKVTAHLVSGAWDGVQGGVTPLTDIHLASIDFKDGGTMQMDIAADKNIFLYVVKGAIEVNGQKAVVHRLVEFNNEGSSVTIKAEPEAIILFGYATPFNEPFMAYGPFVMNTEQEIIQAYEDYRKGKFGSEDI